MSTDPVNEQFAFVREEPPPLLAGSKPRRSSPWRRLGIAFVFISLDLAILACALHLLGIVAIPGLPSTETATPASRPNPDTPAAETEAPTVIAGSPVITKLVRRRKVAPENAPKNEPVEDRQTGDSRGAEESSPENVLESEGLKKAGAGYVFSDEADLQKRLEKARLTFKQTRAAFDQAKQAASSFNELSHFIMTARSARTDLKANVDGQQDFVRTLPRTTNLDKDRYEEENARLSAMQAQFRELDRELGHAEHQLPAVRQQHNKALLAFKSKRSEFLNDGRRLDRTFESRIEEYASLAKDPKIKRSLEAIGQKSGKNFKLNPSQELLSGRDELKKALQTVENTEVPQP